MNTTVNTPKDQPNQRLARRYRFDDPDMDLFFMAALGWGPAGGLDIGEAFHVASTIEDGNAESWVTSFAACGAAQRRQAGIWAARGWRRQAGEARLKAFAAWRSAWQFAVPGSDTMRDLMACQRADFDMALCELGFPATRFAVPWAGKTLPAVFLRQPAADAPVVMVIGGADTSHEDLFLTAGRGLFERGYSVVLADLPGQGATAFDGLHWQSDAERPIGAIIDALVERFDVRTARLALLGLSLGGYFATRAAAHEPRLAAVIASTPFPNPGEMFRLSVDAAHREVAAAAPTSAARVSRAQALWKAGAHSPQEFVARSASMVADPRGVTVPFLSILGAGDSPVFAQQARAWHRDIRSVRKDFVLLDEASGADGHCQVANRRRLVQECAGWLGDVFAC
jgi:pimeloyl-ACP methyl ester carboxylesterase